ncbi:hypothetical protein AAGS40_17595 [Paraburkholderia sp. PREW-6R]|uniref:hypothetical protein n=1 Tax=Paraburkholderia sp. PREW-6R TaxID=3141544 RepID=UPI0031F5AAD9
MHGPAAVTAHRVISVLGRLCAAADTLSSAIAGFALLAGDRAFTFMALLASREPVPGGAGLVLLALAGWLRWRCARSSGDCPVACYNRSNSAIRVNPPASTQPHARHTRHTRTIKETSC